MRLVGSVLCGLFALAVIGACGSSDDDVQVAGNADAGTVTAAYCTKYCNAQSSAGTLAGTQASCLADCCKSVPGGCPAVVVDAGETDDDTDGGDASACKIPCGTACCKTGQACGQDSGGAPACVKTCKVGSDCTTGCCAPAVNAAGKPIGPYVCQPSDGAAYHCCYAVFNSCSSPNCCVTDTNGNRFCAEACSANVNCAPARCIPYTFGASTTCQGPTACGP